MEAIGFVAGFLTLVTYIPQSIKTIRTRKARDLSLLSLIFLITSALLWVVYGLYKHLPALWITNAVVAALGLAILSIKLQTNR